MGAVCFSEFASDIIAINILGLGPKAVTKSAPVFNWVGTFLALAASGQLLLFANQQATFDRVLRVLVAWVQPNKTTNLDNVVIAFTKIARPDSL
jgi:hypothetical protein